MILPFVLAVWLLSFGLKKKKTWLAALIFLGFFILPLIPWGIRNQIVLDDPLRSYSSKAIGVILRKRIAPIVNLFSTTVNDQDTNTQPVETEPTENDPEPETSGGWEMLMDSFVHTGLHNLVTVSLSLPASASHSGLDETIRQPYWDQEWDGTFTHGGQFVLAGSLILAALGFSFGWKRNRLASLVLFVILLPYLLANTLSLVSGGRYIIPVDWVLPVYYSIGIAGVSLWVFALQPQSDIENAANHFSPQIARILPGLSGLV